jgi:hypothetical protein
MDAQSTASPGSAAPAQEPAISRQGRLKVRVISHGVRWQTEYLDAATGEPLPFRIGGASIDLSPARADELPTAVITSYAPSLDVVADADLEVISLEVLRMRNLLHRACEALQVLPFDAERASLIDELLQAEQVTLQSLQREHERRAQALRQRQAEDAAADAWITEHLSMPEAGAPEAGD